MNDINFDTIAKLLQVAGVIFAIVYAVRGGKRADKNDVTQSVVQYTAIETKLGIVVQGVSEINSKLDSQQRQIEDIKVWVTRVDESAKSAHKRIDEMKGE